MVRFNLKTFVEEFRIARESGDLDSEQDLLNSFNSFIKSASFVVKQKSQMYIFNSPIARQYPDLLDVATKCTLVF